jgi:DnaJ like chaperone protein
MGWFFGAGLGWFVGGPLGAIVGAAIQSALSSATQKQLRGSQGQTNAEAIFVTNLVAIMTKICMADGHISKEERNVIHNFFAKSLGYSGEQLRFIDAIINETDRRNPDLRQICLAIDKFANHEQRFVLLDLAYNIAAVDHVITDDEQRAIDEIVSAFNLSHEEHESIKARHPIARASDHYTVLGVDSSASNEELKKAYRHLAKQYHPDKVSHLGGELVEFAHQKFQEINESYQALRNQRGF